MDPTALQIMKRISTVNKYSSLVVVTAFLPEKRYGRQRSVGESIIADGPDRSTDCKKLKSKRTQLLHI